MLLKAHKDISNVGYKDTVLYFGIYNRNVNGWFVRFMLDKQPAMAMIRLEYKFAKEIHSGLKIKPVNSKGVINAYFDSINDMDKLEPFILKAFEVVE